MVLITIVTGANLNQLITGGPHIVGTFYSRQTANILASSNYFFSHANVC